MKTLISLFPSAFANEPDMAISLAGFLDAVKSGKWERNTSPLRDHITRGERDQYNDKKRRLPAVALSCHCLSREKDLAAEAKAITHSGWLQADFDLKDNPSLAGAAAQKAMRARLLADPYVGAVFVGPSGEGIKAVVKIDGTRHKESWFAAEAHFLTVYGLTLDKSTKDPMRLCFVSHDPEGEISEDFTGLPIPEAKKQEAAPAPAVATAYTPNDAGRAQRFVDRFARDIKYVPERGIWFTWTGDRWQVDRDGSILRLAVRLGNEMLKESGNIAGTSKADQEARQEAAREALACGDRRNIQDFIELAKVDVRVLLAVDKLDADPWLVASQNAAIDLKTGTIRSFTREDFTSRELGCTADPQATCPRWRRFMEEVFPDAEVRKFIHKAAGYTLTGDTREQVFFFLHGSGRNGKSKFIEAVEKVLGSYGRRAGKGIVAATERGKYPEGEVAELLGVRLAAATETEEGERMAESVIKDLTGTDMLRGRELFKKGFDFKPACKLWIYGNHKPTVKGTDGGIWRRVRLIPFTQRFEGSNDDRNLADKLAAEAPGILNWMIEGGLLWQKEGIEPPAIVRQAVADYRAEEDNLADFIGSCISEEQQAIALHSEVFKEYQQFCEDSGIRFPITTKALTKKLKERGWRDTFDSRKNKIWLGVLLNRAG